MIQGLRRLAWRHGPAVGGFGVVTTVFYWNVIRDFATRTTTVDGDGSTFLWAYWAIPRAVLRLENPFVTDLLFHPVGAHLAFHTSTPLEAALAWPVASVFGVAVAVNALQVAAAMLSALGAYLLALHVCGNRRAAFFAGLAFAFVPYRFVHSSGHLNLIHAEFLPFGLLAALRLLEEPTRPRAVVLGVVVGLTFLTDFYYFVFLLLGVAVLIVFKRAWRLVGPAVLWRRLAEAAVISAVVALPLLLPIIDGLSSGELDSLPGWAGADVRSADLISWVVPSDRHRLWGSTVHDLRRLLPGGGEGLAYPGLIVLGLALAGRAVGDPVRRRGWVALAACAGVLAMGPFLQIAGRSGSGFSYLGREFALPLPYLVVHLVPVLDSVRVPGRFAILAILALDVLAAATLAALLRRRPAWAVPLLSACVGVLLLELLPVPIATQPIRVPDPYHAIANDPDQGAVLEVPLQWQSGVSVVGDTSPPRDSAIFMYFATVHERPLVSGYVSRYPSQRLDRLKAIPVYREILALTGEPGYRDPPTFDASDLRRLGIGFVVYHRDRPEPAAYRYLDRLGLDRLADDGTILVWRVNG